MGVSQAQLRAFHAVALYGSFTVAAEKLSLSQPAVSDQVKKLEEAYSTQLFVRNRRSVAFTNTGRALLDLTKQLFFVQEKIDDLLTGSKSMSGSLTLAVDFTRHLGQCVSLFHQQYPDVRLEFRTGNSKESLGRLLNSEVDLAVVGCPVQDASLESSVLSYSPIMVVVSATSPLCGMQKVTAEELHGKSWVMRETGSATRTLVENAMRDRNVTAGSITEATGRESVNELVANDVGLGFISAVEYVADSRLVPIPISGMDMVMEESLVVPKGRRHNYISRAFIAIILQQYSNDTY